MKCYHYDALILRRPSWPGRSAIESKCRERGYERKRRVGKRVSSVGTCVCPMPEISRSISLNHMIVNKITPAASNKVTQNVFAARLYGHT